MTRSRISLSIDYDLKVMIIRYIGDLDGDEVNVNMMQHLVNVPEVWKYDSLIDMRRFDGTIQGSEIEDLSKRWAMLAQGRDKGGFTAIVSDDPLVHARLPITQSLFPQRHLQSFATFDEGIDWIKKQRGHGEKSTPTEKVKSL